MDIMKMTQVSLAAKLTFNELRDLYALGEVDKGADLILSLILSAHSVSADWVKNCLDYLEDNKIIDRDRRQQLETNKIADVSDRVQDGAKTMVRELAPHVSPAIERLKALATDMIDRTNIRDMIDGILHKDEDSEDKGNEKAS